ncbi:hypothetical protein B0H21DRAFT_737232, partial [Amylocystis lapponica]
MTRRRYVIVLSTFATLIISSLLLNRLTSRLCEFCFTTSAFRLYPLTHDPTTSVVQELTAFHGSRPASTTWVNCGCGLHSASRRGIRPILTSPRM